MSIEIGLMMGILALAINSFSLERVPAAGGTGQRSQIPLAFSGFGREVVLMIPGLLLLRAALIQTGGVVYPGREILSREGKNQSRFFLL